MKILLAGLLPASIQRISARLEKEGHQVSLLDRGPKAFSAPAVKKILLDKSADHADVLRVLKAARFQAVVFFYAFRCEAEPDSLVRGGLLDDLSVIACSAEWDGAEHLVLVTDRRVFGSWQAGREGEEPFPDSPAGVLIKAAESLIGGVCGRIDTLILRVTSLYAEGDPDSFFSRTVYASQHHEPIMLRGSPLTRCDFLHSDDLARFLCLSIDARMAGAVHLASGSGRRFRTILSRVKHHLPDVKASFTNEAACHTLKTGRVREVGWVPQRDFLGEMEKLI